MNFVSIAKINLYLLYLYIFYVCTNTYKIVGPFLSCQALFLQKISNLMLVDCENFEAMEIFMLLGGWFAQIEKRAVAMNRDVQIADERISKFDIFEFTVDTWKERSAYWSILASFHQSLLCFCRSTEVFFMFGVRAFVTGAFQAAYVYTPEVSLIFCLPYLTTSYVIVGMNKSQAFAYS